MKCILKSICKTHLKTYIKHICKITLLHSLSILNIYFKFQKLSFKDKSKFPTSLSVFQEGYLETMKILCQNGIQEKYLKSKNVYILNVKYCLQAIMH